MNLHDQIMSAPIGPIQQFSEDERLAYLAGHRDARHAAAELALTADDQIRKLREALEWCVNKIYAEICTHEETYRGGSIWTICRNCDMRWADDRGGFKPYSEPKELSAARSALKETE
jgi:hypothetical protein